METLTIEKNNALKAHNEANDKGKQMLENLFGKKVFQQSIIDRVQGFGDACRELGKNQSMLDFVLSGFDAYNRAQQRIETVAEALREGKPASECFYYPYFKTGSGGFSFDGTNYDVTLSNVGARLRVDTSEKAAHLGKIMLEDYKTYSTGK